MTPSHRLPVSHSAYNPSINKHCSEALLACFRYPLFGDTNGHIFLLIFLIKGVYNQFPGEQRLCRFAFRLSESLRAFMGRL